LGGVIRFPRNGRHNELEWPESADDAQWSAPLSSEVSSSWLDAKRRHDGDDDGDGGGRAA